MEHEKLLSDVYMQVAASTYHSDEHKNEAQSEREHARAIPNDRDEVISLQHVIEIYICEHKFVNT
jgi:hypothetical protein